MSSWLPRRKTVVNGFAPAQAQQAIDEPADGRAAIDVVAEEDERVAAPGADRVEQHLELVGTAVQVADREEAHDSLRGGAARPSRIAQQLERRAVGIELAAPHARDQRRGLAVDARARAALRSSPSSTSRNSRSRCSRRRRARAPSLARCARCASIGRDELVDPAVLMGLREQHRHVPRGLRPELQHRLQLGLHADRAFAVGLVDDEDVRRSRAVRLSSPAPCRRPRAPARRRRCRRAP